MTKVFETSLQEPVQRRTVLKVTVEQSHRKTRVTTELGTVTPHTIRWTNYNKLRKTLTRQERAAIESQIIRLCADTKPSETGV